MLIKTVLLPSIEDQNVLDRLVIKVLNNFILNSDSIYSKSRVIESLENLPYSYDKVISYAIEKLYPDQEDVKLTNDVQKVLNTLVKDGSSAQKESVSTKRLLMTVLVLNNLKSHHNQNVSQSLSKINLIASWLIDNVSLTGRGKQRSKMMDFSIMKLIVNYQHQLLTMTGIEDHLELSKKESFITAHTLTVFLIDNKDLNKKLSEIFTLLVNIDNFTISNEELKKKNPEEIEHLRNHGAQKLLMLENLFKFWQKIIQMLLNDETIKEHYKKEESWIQNLLFSIEFYLNSYDNLRKLRTDLDLKKDILSIDEELLAISTISPDFSIVTGLVSLLQSYFKPEQDIDHDLQGCYSNVHLTTLWSLVFEILS